MHAKRKAKTDARWLVEMIKPIRALFLGEE